MQTNPDLTPLSPAVFHILLALSDGDKHGYRIMQTVQAQSGGRLRMGPGTLYGSIKRMLADGLIEEAGERPDPAMDDERRRYYHVTEQGRKALQAEADRIAFLAGQLKSLHLIGNSNED